MPAAETGRTVRVTVDYAGQAVAESNLKLSRPPLTVYILPFAHGHRLHEIQTEIEDKQVTTFCSVCNTPRDAANRPARASSGTSRCSGPPISSCAGSGASSGPPSWTP